MTESRGLRAELRDAVTQRAFVLVSGVLGLQLGFILSYIGAFHHPTPHRIRLAVVAPAPAAQQTMQALSASEALSPRISPSRAAAEDDIRGRRLDGALTGIVGIGLAVLLFVVLGNPSAGGAYPTSLLPPFWRAIGPWLPPGAGTSGLRGIVYFDGAQVLQPMLVALAYAVVGAVVLVVAARRRQPTTSASA